ncbi:MAG TPA: hypothetical protein VK589_07895 [Chryseolinea sp.]|nr:hypothetical protein [Chryseolinea sp.]
MRELMLVFHFIGLAMALGAGFANLFLGSVASKLEPAERGSFMSKTMILGRMGQIGLALLLLSGFYLITPYWKVLGDMPLLIAKLCLVALLLILVSTVLILLRKEKGNPAMLAKIRPLGMLNFLIGITIVVLAVLIFR